MFYYLVPEEIGFNPQTKRVGERCRRTELLHSSVEYIAPSEYMVGYYHQHVSTYNIVLFLILRCVHLNQVYTIFLLMYLLILFRQVCVSTLSCALFLL